MTADEKASYRLTVNGEEHAITDAWYFESLLNVLRDHLGLTGTKYSCDSGQCGACTVQVDGVAVNSCIELAADAIGSDVRTSEGITAADPRARALQDALLRGGDIQCGYCIPGIVMSASAFLAASPTPSVEDVREGMSGNICRCTGYSKILQSVVQAAEVTS